MSDICYGWRYEPVETVDNQGIPTEYEWGTVTSRFFPSGIRKCENYPDIVTGFDLEKDKTYYLVYVEYSTGDSFGEAVNGEFSLIALVETQKEAMFLCSILGNSKPDKRIEWTDKYGLKHSEYPYWHGYFEQLTSIGVAGVRLGND